MKNNNFREIYGVASHDVGGAEILSDWIKNQKDKKYFFSIKGPAVKIFKKKKLLNRNYNIKNLEKKTTTLITSTSWPNRHEIKAIEYFNSKKKKTISFLDHWVNYKIRFFKKNKYILPDEIWTGDIHAYKIAKKIFKKSKILKKKNYTFEKLKKIKTKPKKLGRLLFLSSPNIEFYKKLSTKKQFELFLKQIKKSNLKFNRITLRPHPREKISYFKSLENKYRFLKIRSNSDILDELKKTDIVIGTNSMGLVYAKLLKKKVYFFNYNGKIKNILPYKNILKI